MSGFGPATELDFKREVNEGYLDFVREQECAVWGCIKDADPHHTVSRGAGGSDLSAIPLCREHHTEIHLLGAVRFTEKHSMDLWRVLAGHLASYLRKVGAADD